MYHQPIHPLCNPNTNTVSLNSYDLCISYVDRHDENTVEFPHSHPREFEVYYVVEGELDNLVEGTPKCQSGRVLIFKSRGKARYAVQAGTKKGIHHRSFQYLSQNLPLLK